MTIAAAWLVAIPGEAQAEVCDAAAFACPATGTCMITGTWSVKPGCRLDFGARSVEIRGALQSSVVGGSFAIAAGALVLYGGKLRALGDTEEAGGAISLDIAGGFSMTGTGARIDTGGNGVAARSPFAPQRSRSTPAS